MEVVIYLAVLGVMAYAGHRMAKDKNRDAVLWAVLCGVFGLIPLIILALLPRALTIEEELEKALRESLH